MRFFITPTLLPLCSGRVLPKEFWEGNEFGVKGGIESAFMSTTLNEKVAISYASSGNGTGFVFEIQQGMVDRGADIGARIPQPQHSPCRARLTFGPNRIPPSLQLPVSPFSTHSPHLPLVLCS